MLQCSSFELRSFARACGLPCRSIGFATKLVEGSPIESLLSNWNALLESRFGDLTFKPAFSDTRTAIINEYNTWRATASSEAVATATTFISQNSICIQLENTHQEREVARPRLTVHSLPSMTVGQNLPQISLPRLVDPFNDLPFRQFLSDELSGFGPIVDVGVQGIQVSLYIRFLLLTLHS